MVCWVYPYMDLYGMILLRPKRCFLLSRLRLTSKTPRLTMNTVFIILAVTSDVVKKKTGVQTCCADVLFQTPGSRGPRTCYACVCD